MRNNWSRLFTILLGFFLISLGFNPIGKSLSITTMKAIHAQDDDDFGDDDDDFGDDDDDDDGLGDDSADSGGDDSSDSSGDDNSLGDDDDDDDDDMGGSDADAPADVAPVVKNPSYNPREKDPFNVLVRKRVIIPPSRPSQRRRVTRAQPSRPKPPPVPPINISIMGIVGNESKRLALVKFEGKVLQLSKGFTDSKGKFKVVDVEKEKVIIYSFKEGFRKTFKLPEVKSSGGSRRK